MKVGTKGGFVIGTMITAIIGLSIGIMVFFALLPGIQMAIGNATLTGAQLVLAGLVVTVFIAGIIMLIVKAMIK